MKEMREEGREGGRTTLKKEKLLSAASGSLQGNY